MKQRIVFDAIYDRLEELEYAEVTEFGHYPESFVKMTDRFFATGLESVSVNEKSRILVFIILHFLRRTEYKEILFDSLGDDIEYRAAYDFVNSTKDGVKSILRKSPISLLLTNKDTNFCGEYCSTLEVYQDNKIYRMWDFSGTDEFFFDCQGYPIATKINIGEKELVDVNEQNIIFYEMMHEAIRVDVDVEFYEQSVSLYNQISTATYENWVNKPEVNRLLKTFEILETTESTAVQNYMIGKKEYSGNILDIWTILEYPIVDIYEDSLTFIDELLKPCIGSDKKGREFVDERLLEKVFRLKYKRSCIGLEFEIFRPVRDTFLALFEDIKLTTVFEGITDETRLIRERLRSLTENDKCRYDNLLEYYLT